MPVVDHSRVTASLNEPLSQRQFELHLIYQATLVDPLCSNWRLCSALCNVKCLHKNLWDCSFQNSTFKLLLPKNKALINVQLNNKHKRLVPNWDTNNSYSAVIYLLTINHLPFSVRVYFFLNVIIILLPTYFKICNQWHEKLLLSVRPRASITSLNIYLLWALLLTDIRQPKTAFVTLSTSGHSCKYLQS